jgi:hypothetical protein
MTVAMQGELVSAPVNLPDQLWMALDAFSHQMKCGMHSMSFQDIQQPRRILGVWTVVKRQGDPAARSIPQVEDFRVALLGSHVEAVQGGSQDVHWAVSQLYDI